MAKNQSHGRLVAWRDQGVYPAFYDPMRAAVLGFMRGQSLLDLGCGHGLLGNYLADEMGGLRVIGVDRDTAMIAEAERACVGVRFYGLEVARDTFLDVARIVRAGSVDTLIARHAITEIFQPDLEAARLFAEVMDASGVRQVFLEASGDLAAEADLFDPAFKWVATLGSVAILQS